MFEHLITFQARYRPDAIAISTPVGSATFAGLDADVDRMARRLQPIVPARGRVAVQVQGSGLHWVVLLALARLGCVSASLPPVGERPEADLLAILRPDFLLTDRAGETAADRFVLTPDWVQATFASTAASMAPHRFAPNDPVRIVMSSGTTGAPKKMLLTRAMVDARIKTGGLSQLAHRRLHSAVGLDTETGFRAPLVAWATGYPALYPETGFRWATFLQNSRPQVLLLVPAQLDALLGGLPQDFAPPPDLSLVIISATPSAALHQRARTRLTANIFVVYGSTEAGLACQLSPNLREQADSVTGVVSPSAEVEVVDEAGRVLPVGATGRVRVRTEEMVQGYLDDAALTARFFRDGWFYPGDLGALGDSGRLTLHGREAEILDLGGLRIAPSVIEEVLLAAPGVRDAAAFSVPNAEGVHQARAALVRDPGCDLEAVRQRLRAALPQFDVPLVALGHIPRSERGKIDRAEVRRQAALMA